RCSAFADRSKMQDPGNERRTEACAERHRQTLDFTLFLCDLGRSSRHRIWAPFTECKTTFSQQGLSNYNHGERSTLQHSRLRVNQGRIAGSPLVYVDRKEEAMKVSEIMTRDVQTAQPDTTVEEIAALMKEEGIGAVPVLDEDGGLAGIVTDR